MIVGIGTDMVDTRRIEKLLTRFSTRFTEKVFTPAERVYCMAQHYPAAAFAKRFAAKEAALKALGTGLRAGITWQDIEIFNDAKGKPCLHLSPDLLSKTLGISTQNLDIHVSLADEQPYALAFVVISKTI
jgi:holo-[acyl-carrier protein] synthase